MKITRYFQSCILIEEGSARLLIDPSGQEADDSEKFGIVDAVLYTHEHSDHFDAQLAESFKNKGADIYANASTAKQMMSPPNILGDGQEVDIKGVKVKAMELPHCLMWDGSEGPQNTGFLLDDKLFHPGDGKELAGLEVETMAVPINGPDVSMLDAYNFIKQLKAKNVIPIHYDYLGGNADAFVSRGGEFGFTGYALKQGQTVEL